MIGPLTDPADRGADPADAFHVVIPSLPGYGFSTPVAEAGWGNLFQVAQAWAELMSRLGYERYAVHGTDVGSGVADLLPIVAADHVVGTHLSGTVAAMPFGPPLQTEGLTGKDRERAERFNEFRSGVAVFAADTTIKRVMDPHGEIEHWSEFDRGGHFPAMETPDLLVSDIRDFYRPLR